MPTGARTITVIREPKVDKLSTPSTDEAPETDITGVIILPRQFFEAERGWVTIEGYSIYILASSKVQADPSARSYADGDILHSDKILIDGATWQVDGPPAGYDKGSTRKATLVQVKRVGT